mmetsp:Transcript_137857/g.251118  ORF Transcript_137857/g.251118 Transcript_137857/m.251118 type:complete len:489 (+) Transcript_137857:46-1512(+)
MQPLPSESSDSDGASGWERRPQGSTSGWRLKFVLSGVGLALCALVAIISFRSRTAPDTIHGTGNFMSAASSCGPAPFMSGKPLDDVISSTPGILIVANSQMRCTQAAISALQQKGMKYTLKEFETPFAYEPGASDIWDWLHCSYPDDMIGGGTIMHSYIFLEGTFEGQGFAAADKIQQGLLSGPTGGKSCEDQFSEQAEVLKHYQADPNNKILLFGWLSCPCTSIAQSRFAEASVCYEGRTWANPSSQLMAYLQCREAKSNDHSFVYFRTAEGAWDFVGNGFMFDENAMLKEQFDSLVMSSDAETDCKHANVKVNVFGTALEECRTSPADMMGSWQDDGTCSEQIGGIHEICIESLPADFSTETHQPPWSEERADKRHCVCVGAWSLYMTDAEKHPENAAMIMPHCKAIPETALTSRYLHNWKDWNGYPASVVDGVGQLVERCLNSVSDTQLQCGLRKRFDALREQVPELAGPSLQGLEDRLQQLYCA